MSVSSSLTMPPKGRPPKQRGGALDNVVVDVVDIHREEVDNCSEAGSHQNEEEELRESLRRAREESDRRRDWDGSRRRSRTPSRSRRRTRRSSTRSRSPRRRSREQERRLEQLEAELRKLRKETKEAKLWKKVANQKQHKVNKSFKEVLVDKMRKALDDHFRGKGS